MKVISNAKLQQIDALAAQLAESNRAGARLIDLIMAKDASIEQCLKRIDALEARIAAVEQQRGDINQ